MRIILGVAFMLCLAIAFLSAYRVGVGAVSLVVLWCYMALVCAMALFTREVVASINGLRDSQGNTARNPSVVADRRPPGLTKRPIQSEPAPIGQLPGETVEQWAKRVETEEAAAFKAKSRGQS